MRSTRPTVEEFMTHAPVVVSPGDSLAGAMHTMITHRVRHLPVCDEGRIVGVVSQRDVYYAQAHQDGSARVIDAMTQFVYTVRPDTPLEEVARDLEEAKYGAAVVVLGEQVVGVFTTIDALHALTTVLAELRRSSTTQPHMAAVNGAAPKLEA
ncbi:MAG TPA: CBS domain-containing protein [Byssovorax sp.]|jgi:acetoin utilization protein AcuB